MRRNNRSHKMAQRLAQLGSGKPMIFKNASANLVSKAMKLSERRDLRRRKLGPKHYAVHVETDLLRMCREAGRRARISRSIGDWWQRRERPCVKHGDYWCAASRGHSDRLFFPPIPTLCGLSVRRPKEVAVRAPTCPRCLRVRTLPAGQCIVNYLREVPGLTGNTITMEMVWRVAIQLDQFALELFPSPVRAAVRAC